MLSNGQEISHYKIISRIGAGGMGEVYLAQDTRLDRKVAIKCLNQEFSKDADKLKRFIQEARAASGLNHPHILTVYEIGETDDTNYIVTELIDGKTLREHLSHKDSLPLNSILKIGVQTAEALSAAHQAGIIHRDIKPENIMIRRDGYAKVLDFGLAKLSEPPASAGGMAASEDATRAQINTTPGMVMGTVSYMSPEQARGLPTDARTDIWSLGVVLYEMLADRVPFSGETVNHTIVSILEKEPLLLENVPDELQRIVRKSLTKDVEMRYQSARDFLIDLKNLRRHLDIKGELERSVVPNRETASSPHENATQMLSGGRESTISGQTAATQNVTTSSSSLEYAVSQAKSHKLVSGIAGLLLLGVIFVGGYFAFVRGSGSKQINSIAVMPFVNEGGNADLDYLSDGMTETLISSLSQLPNLSVKGRSSAFRYKGKETDAKTIGKELGVQAILNGRVLQRGDQLTLRLELIDASTENVIWSEQYNRRQTDIVSLQSEIARDVSQKLKTKLSGAEEQKLAKTYTSNPEAYQLYLKGRFYWNKRNAEAFKTAIGYFNQAIEKDPSYALAYAGLSDAYGLIPLYAAGSPQEFGPKAKAAARKAVELDDTLAEAHTSLASALASYDWNLSDAAREFQRAIELNPNYATAHQWFSDSVLLPTGRFDEAIAEMKRAQELDPLSLIINADVGLTYMNARQYDKGIAQLRKTIEMDQGFYFAHQQLGIALDMKGSFPEALSEYQTAMRLSDDPSILGLIGHAYAVSGKRDEASKTLEKMKEISNHRYIPALSFAYVYTALGDKDQAFQWLEKSYQDHGPDFVLINTDPLLDNLHSDPRFADLVRRVGLP